MSLSTAYGIKRKNKKMAKGGPVSAKTEARPMPDQRGEETTRNDGDKAPKNDSWTSTITQKQAGINQNQAGKPSITKLSRPRMVETNAFSVKLRDQEDYPEKSMPPESPKNQPKENYDEEDADESGTPPHKMKMMAKGGKINDDVSMKMAEEDEQDDPHGLESDDDHESMPVDEYMAGSFAKGGMVEDEEEMEHAADIASAIMAARRMRMAEGGQVDIDENAEEQPNDYDARNSAVLKENYDSDMDDMSDPMDSNRHADPREDMEENHDDKDIVASIIRKMKNRSPITR